MKTLSNFLEGQSLASSLLVNLNPGKKMNKIFCFFCMFFLTCLQSYNVSAQSSSSKSFNGPVVFINLMRQSEQNPVLIDGVAAMYADKFSCAVDSNDAEKLYNVNQGIYLSRDGKNLSIEARQIPMFKDTLFIQLWSLSLTSYLLQIVPQNVIGNMQGKAWLIDKYLNTRKELDFYKPSFYNFSPDTNSTKSYLNRFMIVFNRVRQATPVKIETNKVEKTDSAAKNGKINLYPNPVVGNTINLKFENVEKGDYNIILLNGNGNSIYTSRVHHFGGNNNYIITTNPNKINTGLYTLVVSGANNKKSINLPLVINK